MKNPLKAVPPVLRRWIGIDAREQHTNIGGTGQHFLLSSRARTLSLIEVLRMSDDEAFATFMLLRWPDTYGKPVCPSCTNKKCYFISTTKRFKCAVCFKHFSVTSGTIFHSRKKPLRDYLAVIALYANAVKGIPALQISRDLDFSYKSAFVLLHKIRGAIRASRQNLKLKGHVEVDGIYVGGYSRPPNLGRNGRKLTVRKPKRCMLSLTERGGPSIMVEVRSENSADILATIRKHVHPDAVIFADQATGYDVVHALHECHRINHTEQYSDGFASTNQAECMHSLFRRAEKGQYHHVSGDYLEDYANEVTYKRDRRRTDNGTIFAEILSIALSASVSGFWLGYWQKRVASHSLSM